jgi:hypothetical protein
VRLTILRASYFSYISSTSYVVSFLGPTLASFTMSRKLWLPFWINIVLLACAVPTISLLPTTRNTQIRMIATTEEADALLDERDESPSRYSNAFESRPGISQSVIRAARKLVHLVTGRRHFQILLVSFFLTALASSDTKLLVQYISKRYEWTFAQAGYMLSAKAIVNFTLLAIIVPRIIKSSMSSKALHGSEARLNYLGAEVSILVSVVGVLCVALAFRFWMLIAGKHIGTVQKRTKLTVTALVIYALGSALPVFTMSLVKSPLIALADSDVQDFSIVMLTKTLGSLVGAPLMTVLWVWAIKIGSIGLGLPYFVSAVSIETHILDHRLFLLKCIYLAAAIVITRLKISCMSST